MRLTALLAAALATGPLAAETVTPRPDPARELVKQLGDRSYRTRAHAARQLLALGRAAEGAVAAGVSDPDAEVRHRCADLLPLVRRSEAERRLNELLLSETGEVSFRLPGWDRFRREIGSDRPSRDLFAELYASEGGRLLELLDTDPAETGRRFAQRCTELQRRSMRGLRMPEPPGPPTPGDLTAALFLLSDPRLPADPNTVNTLFYCFYTPHLRQAVEPGRPIRKVVNAALARCAADPNLLEPAVRTAQNFGLNEAMNDVLRPAVSKVVSAALADNAPAASVARAFVLSQAVPVAEALPLAVKTVTAKGSDVFVRSQAVLVIADRGNRDHLSVVTPLLADKTDLGSANMNNISVKAKVCDVALAAAAKLSGQKPADYGMPLVQMFPDMDLRYLSPNFYGFADDKSRDAALDRWRERAAKQQNPSK